MTVHRSRWYSSFYWRIGVSFVVLVAVVLVVQSAMYSYMMARAEQGALRPPNAVAATIAAEAGSALARDAAVDLAPMLHHHDVFSGAYVVLKDGRLFASRRAPLADDMRLDAQAVLSGVPPGRVQRRSLAPVITAPIQVGGELRGMVVMRHLHAAERSARSHA